MTAFPENIPEGLFCGCWSKWFNGVVECVLTVTKVAKVAKVKIGQVSCGFAQFCADGVGDFHPDFQPIWWGERGILGHFEAFGAEKTFFWGCK